MDATHWRSGDDMLHTMERSFVAGLDSDEWRPPRGTLLALRQVMGLKRNFLRNFRHVPSP